MATIKTTIKRRNGTGWDELRPKTEVDQITDFDANVPDVINDLSNVNAPSPSNGQALVWDNSTSKWVPGTVASTFNGGTITSNLTISNTLPTITFTDTNNNSDFNIANNNGVFTVGDTTNQLDRFRIYSSGDIEITGSSVDISGVTLLNDNGTLKWDGDKVETEEFASSYTAIASNGWNDYALGRGIFSRSNSSGLPSGGTHGYWLTLGRRDVLGGYAGIYVNDYSTSGSGVYIGRNDSGGNPTWEKVWTDKTDGSGSGLDADTLDGSQATSFLRSDTTDYYDRLLQSSTGVPTNNLGSPSITEMALFQEQFNNKTAFYTISNLKFYTSSDGTNWTEYTSFSDTDKRKFLGGDNNSGIVIPNLTDYFRIELTNNGNYVFLNALYMYWSSNSHSTTVKIRKQRGDGVWSQHTNSSATVSSWPGHLYLPFGTIAFHPSTTSTSHYRTIHIDFEPNWSGHATYGSYNINLYRMQIWGGYPAGKRTLYTVDEYKRVIFPEDVRIGGDSKRLDLARGTTSSQPKIIVGEQGTYGLQLRWDSGTKAHFDRFWSTSIDGTPSSQMMTFDIQNDRIGIGTTSPRQKLDVIGKIQISNGLTLRDNSIEQHLTNGNANVAVNYYGYANGHSQFRDFDIYNGKGGLIARFDGSSSNVGIGTTIPASPLHAYKNTSSGSNVISLETLNNKWDFRIGNSGEFLIRDGSYDRLTINNSNGNATFANDLTVQGDLFVSGSFTTIDTDTTTTEQWSVTNDGTGPAVIINQKGSQPVIDIQDDGTSVFHIEDGGNVGIGTTNPTRKLHINSGTNDIGLLVESSDQFAKIGLKDNTTTSDAQVLIAAVGNDMFLEAGGSEKVRIKSGGNVGIGTSSPDEKLTVLGTIKVTSDNAAHLILDGDNNNSGDTGQTDSIIDFLHDNEQYGFRMAVQNYSGANTFNLQDKAGTAYTSRLFIDSSGNVGIGTTSPSEKLEVNGNINANELHINDTNTIVKEGSGNSVRMQTNSGYIDIGPNNTGWGHIQTDRGRFYFNKGADFDGDVRMYDNNTTKMENSTGYIYELGNRVLTTASDVLQSYEFSPGSSNGSRRFVRLFTLNGFNNSSGAFADVILSGSGDYGDFDRTALRIMAGERGNAVTVDVYSLNSEDTSDAPIIYYKSTGTANSFEIWAQLADYNYQHRLSVLAKQGGFTVNLDSITTTTPSGLNTVTQKTLWHSGNGGTGSGLDADTLDTKHASDFVAVTGDTMTGTLTIDTGAGSEDALVIKGTAPTINLLDDTSGADDFYLHANSNNFYILTDRGGGNQVGTGWETPYPLQLEADTNIGYVFGQRIFNEAYHPNADKWTTARTITLGGDLSGSVSLDGSANVTLTATVANDSHTHSEYLLTAGDTMSGDLTISKTSPSIILSDTNTATGNYPKIQFDTNNNQGIKLYHTEFDSELPVGGYGLVVAPSDNNTQFPTTGTLSLAVLGEIYAGNTSLGSTNKVFHDAYHPNADKWTTARTITLGGDLTGNVSIDGSANVTLSAQVTALDDKAEVTYTSGGTTSNVSTLNFSLSGSTLTITTS